MYKEQVSYRTETVVFKEDHRPEGRYDGEGGKEKCPSGRDGRSFTEDSFIVDVGRSRRTITGQVVGSGEMVSRRSSTPVDDGEFGPLHHSGRRTGRLDPSHPKHKESLRPKSSEGVWKGLRH